MNLFELSFFHTLPLYCILVRVKVNLCYRKFFLLPVYSTFLMLNSKTILNKCMDVDNRGKSCRSHGIYIYHNYLFKSFFNGYINNLLGTNNQHYIQPLFFGNL